ncbi:MAG: hypothetical protein HY235_04830 [Acidobacteria bacterium]|nr:hypothetical protein [Acidobacteriota bacterium]
MRTPWNLDDLEVIGYANVLTESTLPSIVPPVFRLKADHTRAFLPPFSISEGFLWNATEVPVTELEELRDASEITLFHSAFPAQGDYELWVDQAFEYHYQPSGDARQALSRIAAESIGNAEAALARGDIEEADRLSGVAISADSRRVEPLAIKAAIRRMKKDANAEHLMAKLAARALDEGSFALLVGGYCRMTQAKSAPVMHQLPAQSAMCGMAALSVN